MCNDNEVLKELTERLHCIDLTDEIDIKFEGNIAVLHGNVHSLAKKNELAMTAAYVAGVEGVENRLTVSAPEYIL